MKTFGFSLIEVLVAMVLLSAVVLLSFELLQHFYGLEKQVEQMYVDLHLVV